MALCMRLITFIISPVILLSMYVEFDMKFILPATIVARPGTSSLPAKDNM